MSAQTDRQTDGHEPAPTDRPDGNYMSVGPRVPPLACPAVDEDGKRF